MASAVSTSSNTLSLFVCFGAILGIARMLGNSPQPAGKGGPPARARGRSRATDCKPPGRPRATFRAAPSSAFSPPQRAREGPGHAPATPPRCPAPVRPAAAGGGGGIGRGAATAERRAATSPPPPSRRGRCGQLRQGLEEPWRGRSGGAPA